jgi:hypothetical protein
MIAAIQAMPIEYSIQLSNLQQVPSVPAFSHKKFSVRPEGFLEFCRDFFAPSGGGVDHLRKEIRGNTSCLDRQVSTSARNPGVCCTSISRGDQIDFRCLHPDVKRQWAYSTINPLVGPL